ncbi:hypothetical protein QBC43DRAFT_290925 [Cladorrhinum sp. PSN259]|nr:hypothetical protein QBC43DRAFT_290925 [Cladorrhinum sp. PSN259]
MPPRRSGSSSSSSSSGNDVPLPAPTTGFTERNLHLFLATKPPTPTTSSIADNAADPNSLPPSPLDLNYSTFPAEDPGHDADVEAEAGDSSPSTQGYLHRQDQEHGEEVENHEANTDGRDAWQQIWKDRLCTVALWVVVLPLMLAALYICVDLLRE